VRRLHTRKVARSANNNARGARSRPRILKVSISALRDVRRALTVQGDVASDVAFQNDVNALLAVISRLAPAPAAEEAPLPEPRAGLLPSRPPRRARSGTRR
jgi:hypothetical protein